MKEKRRRRRSKLDSANFYFFLFLILKSRVILEDFILRIYDGERFMSSWKVTHGVTKSFPEI